MSINLHTKKSNDVKSCLQTNQSVPIETFLGHSDSIKKNVQLCSSLSSYKIELTGTTKVLFRDKSKFAFVANEGGTVNGVGDTVGFQQSSNLKFFTKQLVVWEVETFLLFRSLIQSDMTYIGFGEWIGPTILYSAQLAMESFGLEPDAIAYRHLILNAVANHCFGDRLKVFPYCIHSHTGSMGLKNAFGGSGSTLSLSNEDSSHVQSIECTTLSVFLANHSLINRKLFIKVDIEGSEPLLFSQFVQISNQLLHKPTWFISKHASEIYQNQNIRESLLELAGMYKCARYAPASHETAFSDEMIQNFKVSTLNKIDMLFPFDATSNPDMILVDEDCLAVDEKIRQSVQFFV